MCLLRGHGSRSMVPDSEPSVVERARTPTAASMASGPPSALYTISVTMAKFEFLERFNFMAMTGMIPACLRESLDVSFQQQSPTGPVVVLGDVHAVRPAWAFEVYAAMQVCLCALDSQLSISTFSAPGV